MALIVGNWKMNGLAAALGQADALAIDLARQPATGRVALCPPATLIARMAARLADSPVEVGGQDCSAEASGAYTGDVSAAMLADADARWVILGHSERREGHGETDALVAAKVEAAVRAGLTPIVCVGETQAEREAGRALKVVAGQLAHSLPEALGTASFAIAYEPIWAIGSGLTPSREEIAEVHVALRDALRMRWPAATAPILYGGSVKPANAADILKVEAVGGALVGGASLMADDFLAIIRAAG